MKHILAIIIVLGILAGGFIYLPMILEKQETSSETDSPKLEQGDTVDTAVDTLSFKEKMITALAPLQVSYSKRKKREIWTMGGGETIIMYLLQTKRFVNKNGGKVLYMEELYNNSDSVSQAARVDILTDKGDSLKLEVQVSRNEFKPGASLLAVAFQTIHLTPELIVALKKIEYPYDLLVPPFGPDDDFYRSLDKINNKELVLWMAMESTKLNRVHNQLRPLRIHHTEEQIENVISEAYQKVPDAVGIATRFGEQAVEHRQLLQAILNPASERDLWFLDISMNKLSIVPQTCKDMQITCKSASPYNPENSSLADYTKARMREARRSGLSVMIIPLSLDVLEKMSNLPEKAKNQGTTLVNLSTFMKK